MQRTTRPRCPKCTGQLYLEQDVHSQFRLPADWTCLQCGWRRAYTPRQFVRTFALTIEVDDAVSNTAAALRPA